MIAIVTARTRARALRSPALLALLRQAREISALALGGASSDRIDLAAAASINNLDPMTIAMWCYPTSVAANKLLASKGTAVQNMQLTLRSTGGELEFFRIRATTNTAYRSSGLGVVAGKWHSLVATYDSAQAVTGHLYRGFLQTPMVEVPGYSTATAGAGANTDDSGGPWRWANLFGASPTNALVGRLAAIAVFNRVLTLKELRNWESEPWLVLRGCVALAFPGFDGPAGKVIDWSGAGNHGTVTGTARAKGLPLLRPARRCWWPVLGRIAGGASAALAGTATLMVTGTAALTTDIRLGGVGTLALTGGAALVTDIRLAASGTATISGTAALTTDIRFVGAATAFTMTGTAALTTSIVLVGVAALSVTGVGVLFSPAPAIIHKARIRLAHAGVAIGDVEHGVGVGHAERGAAVQVF